MKQLGYYWEGDSVLDGAPIACVFNGLYRPSGNIKTGEMVQSWIIRADVNPAEAQKNGADLSICGDCRRRPLRYKASGLERCYVRMRAPISVWKALQKGRYKPLPSDHGSLREIFVGRSLRMGAYGDPAAVPFSVWASILATGLKGHTGYTHAWMYPRTQRLKSFVMASVDTIEERAEAASMGWRTFGAGVPKGPKDLGCPASKEENHRLSCYDCNACGGTLYGQSHVVIAEH